jgi:hypothetical protein
MYPSQAPYLQSKGPNSQISTFPSHFPFSTVCIVILVGYRSFVAVITTYHHYLFHCFSHSTIHLHGAPPNPVSHVSIQDSVQGERHTSSQRKIPCLTCTAIQPTGIESTLTKELPRRRRVYDRQVRIENSLPSTNHGIRSPIREIHVPLLSHKLLRSRQGARWKQRQHVDALYVLDIRAEVSCVVNFVLEKNP